jgi:hypothetical protein
MAYIDPLEPATPLSTEVAGQGDDRIRELKRAIIERLETFFESIDGQPLTVKLDAINAATAFSNNSFPGSKLQDGSVSLAKLVTLPGLTPGQVDATAIADGSVTEPKLADGAVSTRTIGDGQVVTAALADLAVRRAKLYGGLQADLVRFSVFTLVLGAAVIPAGQVLKGSVVLDTNNQVGGGVACVIEPAFTFADASAPINVTDYILAQCSVTLDGSQETLIYRLHNLLASTVDLTGQVYFIHMFQRLSTAPAEV